MDFCYFFELYYEYIVAGIVFLLAVVSFLVTLFTKKSVSKSINSFDEVLQLKEKFKTADTRVRKKQAFSEEVDDYILNVHTNELELSPIPKNLQDYINSHIDTALERALQRFMPDNVINDDNAVSDYAAKLDDLAALGEAMEVAEDYREKFNLPTSYSMADIYSFVDKQANTLKNKLTELKGNGQKKEIIEKSE